jgi:hypothetical protein
MVYLFKAAVTAATRCVPPERRRVVVIGAGVAGISAAWHLGEHCLLLEQRGELEDSNDLTHDLTLGTARGGALGREGLAAESSRQGVSARERKALFISCGTPKLTYIERWRPPEFTPPPSRDEFAEPPSVRALVPLLRAELRFGERVLRISPSEHLIELSSGHRIVFDQLLSTLPMPAMARLVMHELPARVRCDEILRYWLGENDIELADRATQEYYGDPDDFAAGKRIAGQIDHALKSKFGGGARVGRLFEPRIVRASPAIS